MKSLLPVIDCTFRNVMPGRCNGQLHTEGGTFALNTLNGNVGTQHIGDALDQAQTQANAFLTAALISLIEFVENAFLNGEG